ncbi:RE2 [Symbiodinium sp. CCMP2592]|nr:RE2 [Symbiodinium sp. CCMP2592]
MPRVPEMFKLASDDDRGDEPEEDSEAMAGIAHEDPGSPAESVERQSPQTQGPENNEWRCLRCDGNRWVQNVYGTWLCCSCESTEAYSCRRPHRHETDEGVWMFMPRQTMNQGRQGPRADVPAGRAPALLSRRERRRRRAAHHPGGDPSESSLGDASEVPESETLTFDPLAEQTKAGDFLPGDASQHFRTYLTASTLDFAHNDFASEDTGPLETDGRPDPRLGDFGIDAAGLKRDDLEVENGAREGGEMERRGTTATDPRAFSKYCKKVSLWRIQVSSYLTPREAALSLYTSLTGEAETELEHAPIESINTDKGIDFILETLRAPMEQKVVFQKRKFLSEYENIQRQPGEGLRAFSNRYRRSERNLRAVNVEVTQMYDSDARGNRLLDIAESMHMQYPEFRAAPPVCGRDGNPLPRKGDGKGKTNGAPGNSASTSGSSHAGHGKGYPPKGAPRRVYKTDQVGEQTLDEIPEEPEERDDEPDEQDDQDAEAHQDDGDEAEDADDDPITQAMDVLTVTAKKLSSLKLGRKFSGGPKGGKGGGRDIAAQKRTSNCAVCGQTGHWKGDPECPATPSSSSPSTAAQPKGAGKEKRPPHQAFFVKDFGAVAVQDEPGSPHFGTMFQVNVVFEVQAGKLRDPDPDFQDLMILDTACQRTCCGKGWLASFSTLLEKFGLQCHRTPFRDAFQFGAGKPVVADHRSYLPVGIGGTNLLIGAGALGVEIPLLASNGLLDDLGMILDLPNSLVTFATLSVTVPLLRVGGHLTVRISDFCPQQLTWQALQESVDWENPPPELVVQGELCDSSSPTAPRTSSAHAWADRPAGHSTAMVAQVAALRGEPHRLPQELLRDPHHGGAPAAGADRDLRGGAPEAGQSLRAPTEHLQASRLCPVRQRLREVRQVQAVPQEVAVECRPPTVGRTSRQGLRHQVARFATSLAIFLQYCTSGLGGGGFFGDTAPAVETDFFERGFSEDLLGTSQTRLSQVTAGDQWQRNGAGSVASLGHGSGLRLGKRRRLKGDWARSARILENEVELYARQPCASSRPPPAVDLLVIYPGNFDVATAAASLELSSLTFPPKLTEALPDRGDARQQALRALRRLKPHVIYFSFSAPQLNSSNDAFVTEMVEAQTAAGGASLMLGPPGPSFFDLGSRLDMASTTFGHGPSATTFFTTIPGACASIELAAAGDTENFGIYRDAILYTIRDYVRAKDPGRFGLYQTFVTYRTPVSKLEEWSEIASLLERSFGAPGTRPFYIDPTSELGRKIADLFRIKVERIQAVQTPSQRRLPQDVPYTARGAYLIHNDGTKSIELEDLSLVQQPKQRFAKPVRYGLLVYGHLIAEDEPKEDFSPSAPVSGLPTDVSFPGLSTQVPVEVRRSIARAHINMGHPTAEELIRMANAAGTPSSLFVEAIRKLHCATCARLKGPQAPRPATSTVTATQFGDRVEIDLFYLRDLRGRSCMVLGAVDVATRFHQAAILSSRDPQDAYDAFEAMWLRPFGLMVQVGLDPDPTFQGNFQERLRSHGVLVDYCAAEAHWQIGHVERQNAFLRTVLEKLVDTFAATEVADIRLLLAPALHAVNSMTLSRGRSAYQAVFGRVPRLPGGLLTDSNSLAMTPTDDPAATAEIIRSEALKTLCDMNVRQSLRRALLRKTINTKVPQLEPGQSCSYWRWRKRGLKKRGGWITARFLSWDPASPGKLAWVRSGTTTAMVAVEQLRAATGFEAWLPTEPDVAALKDAARKLDETLWADETGPPPPRQHLHDDNETMTLDNIDGNDVEMDAALTSAAALAPVLPAATPGPAGPATQINMDLDQSVQNLVYQPTVQNTYVRNTARLGDPSQGHPGAGLVDLLHFSHNKKDHSYNKNLQNLLFLTPVPSKVHFSYHKKYHSYSKNLQNLLFHRSLRHLWNQASSGNRESVEHPPTTPISSTPTTQEGEPADLLPAKRPFDTLTTFFLDEGDLYHCPPGQEPVEGYGPLQERCYKAYLTSKHRSDDLKGEDKHDVETDTSDSDWSDAPPSKQERGMTRAEAKALDREIPWRKIMEMDPADIQAYVAATEKEAKSWNDWGSVRPLSSQEAQAVLRDKILCKRVLRTRSCFRDKSKGLGPLAAKCRVVALGHKDPDIYRLNRECATPNRTSEHVLFIVLTAGSNMEFDNSKKKWHGWSGDAATAFLQGDLSDTERQLPLYLLPPNDGITALTSCWKAPLYLVCTNVYGLSNAPRLWSLTVIKRLCDLGYRQHSFDKMVFLKFNSQGELISLIIVYVDDFLGTYRSDYNVSEVHEAFKWGSLQSFEVGKPVTFKGKQITLRQRANGRHYLHVCQREFISGMASGKIPRGSKLEDPLTSEQRAEFRSVTGCLQWVSGQSRPELSAVNSLSNHGSSTTVGDLKGLYEAVDFAVATKDNGFVIPDVPVNKASYLVTFSDASWANAENCRSQCGVLVLLTGPGVLQKPAAAMLLDWRSSRSQRVCRSTLAAEASAADEGCDRGAYINMFLSELLYNEPAHRVTPRLTQLAVTDAKSLYDVVISDTPNLTDKRSLVNVRAIQEVVPGSNFHWVPTYLMWADGLTKSSKELQQSLHEWLQQPRVTLKSQTP